jgi:hypothetical protein
MPTLHAFVISWPGQEDSAAGIAQQVRSAADHVTVIHSCRDDLPLPDRPDWVQLPDAHFYGEKYRRSLALNQGEVMLHIHADAWCADWAALVQRCRQAYLQVPTLGVWGANTEFTPFHFDEVRIGAEGDHNLVPVAQTDSVVWSVSAPVMARLRHLDFSPIPLGWGIDWAAIAYCLAHGLLVVRDRQAVVQHPQGSGYDRLLASRQMVAFLAQLAPAERVALELASGYVSHRRMLLGRAP